MNLYVGIDVGKEGAITFIGDQGVVESFVTPTLPDGDIDAPAMFHLIDTYKKSNVLRMTVIEKVHAIFGASAGTTFEFGRSAGIAEGIVCSSGIPYMMIPPKTWQKELWAGVDKIKKSGKNSTDTKATSLIAVKRLFPSAVLVDKSKPRSQKVHDGIVDSILLAEYGRRLWSGITQ